MLPHIRRMIVATALWAVDPNHTFTKRPTGRGYKETDVGKLRGGFELGAFDSAQLE